MCPTDMLQFYECKSWVHYACTELPTYTLVSLENPRNDFLVSYTDTFLKEMKQISSSKNSNNNSSKASIDTVSQLQSQLETSK